MAAASRDLVRQEPDMKRFPPVDLSLTLSLVTVLGMAMAAAGRWLPSGAFDALELPGWC